jgi:hypothetical protein
MMKNRGDCYWFCGIQCLISSFVLPSFGRGILDGIFPTIKLKKSKQKTGSTIKSNNLWIN